MRTIDRLANALRSLCRTAFVQGNVALGGEARAALREYDAGRSPATVDATAHALEVLRAIAKDNLTARQAQHCAREAVARIDAAHT